MNRYWYRTIIEVFLNKLKGIIQAVVLTNILSMIFGYSGKYSVVHFFYNILTIILLGIIYFEAKSLEKRDE